MFCPACHDLMEMIADEFIEMEESGEQHWLCTWRCSSCGETVEPEITRHRLIRGSLWTPKRRCGWRREAARIG